MFMYSYLSKYDCEVFGRVGDSLKAKACYWLLYKLYGPYQKQKRYVMCLEAKLKISSVDARHHKKRADALLNQLIGHSDVGGVIEKLETPNQFADMPDEVFVKLDCPLHLGYSMNIPCKEIDG